MPGPLATRSPHPLPLDRTAWRPLVRDAFLLYLLTFWGGVVLGLSGFGPSPANLLLFMLVTSGLLVVGFTIAGIATSYERRHYLPSVACVLWLMCFVNVPLGFDSLATWLFSLIAYLLYTALGGGLSWLIVRSLKPAIAAAEHHPA